MTMVPSTLDSYIQLLNITARNRNLATKLSTCNSYVTRLSFHYFLNIDNSYYGLAHKSTNDCYRHNLMSLIFNSEMADLCIYILMSPYCMQYT